MHDSKMTHCIEQKNREEMKNELLITESEKEKKKITS